MKILYLDHAPYEGGAEVSLKLLVANLDKEKFEPVVVAPPGAPYLEEIVSSGVRHIPFNYNWKKYGAILPLLVDINRLLTVVRTEAPDIIHTNTRVTNIIGGLLFMLKTFSPMLKPFKVINHVRDKDQLPSWKFKLISQCDLVIANSYQVKKFLVEGGLTQDLIEVIYNGVDLSMFESARETKKEGERPTIGFIGQIYPRKGLQFLIPALKQIKQNAPDVLLRIVGKDPDDRKKNTNELKKMIQENDLIDNVEWVGYLDYKTEIPEFLSTVDVFVLPALEEPFGRVLIDAMAMNKPTVATKVGGIPEIVVDGVSGYLVDAKNAEQLADRINALLKDEDKLIEFGSRGRHIVEERFDIYKHVENIQSLYGDLLKSQSYD